MTVSVRRLLFVVLLLVGTVLAVDRLGSVWAAHEVANAVRDSEGLPQTPDVAIHGVPFLTQVAAGEYDDVEATVHRYQRGGVTIDRINVHLRGVHVPFSDLITDDVQQVPVDRVEGSVRLAYDDLAQAARRSIQVSYAGDGRVRVSGSVDIAGVSVGASGTGGVSLANDRVTVAIDEVSVSGGGSASVTAAVRQEFGFTVRLPSLPFGIALQSVKAEEAGIVIAARGSHITLRTR